MEPGEKYLTIQLFGKDGIKIKAFPTKEPKENSPHFSGDGVAVWVNIVKEREQKPKSVI